jgi:hypothetical protein
MQLKHSLSVIISLSLLSSVGGAEEFSSGDFLPDEKGNRFSPYGVNSVVIQNTENDDVSVEGHMSFRYTLFDCRRNNTEDNWNTCRAMDKDRLQFLWHFTYTGEFDFYADSRDSDPVINRISNPALHFQWLWQSDNWIDYIDIGLEHRSDGQVIEIDERDENDNLLTQIAYDENDFKYFDGLSRGSNYLSFNTGSSYTQDWDWRASVKLYLTHDTDINWGPLANQGVNIADYDIFNIAFKGKVPIGDWKFPVVAEYTIGNELFDTDSLELSIGVPVETFRLSLPFYFKFHFGPMDTLSNYTESVYSVSFGLVFNWY